MEYRPSAPESHTESDRGRQSAEEGGQGCYRFVTKRRAAGRPCKRSDVAQPKSETAAHCESQPDARMSEGAISYRFVHQSRAG